MLIFYLPLFDVPIDYAESINVYIFNEYFELSYIHTIVYCLCSSVMNIGWASLQIAHLSLIPQITPVEKTRTELVS